MSKAIRNDRWCIVTGQDFRERFIVGDAAADISLFAENPNYDPSKPINAFNPKLLPPPKDLTGVSGQMDIRDKPSRSQGTLIVGDTTDLGITIGDPDPVDGTVELFIDSTKTNTGLILAAAGTIAFYDFFLIFPNPEDNLRFLIGEIPIVESITDVN